jgi:hypothetical protein
MVLISPLSYGLASYRRPGDMGEVKASTSYLSCLSWYAPFEALRAVDCKRYPVLPRRPGSGCSVRIWRRRIAGRVT